MPEYILTVRADRIEKYKVTADSAAEAHEAFECGEAEELENYGETMKMEVTNIVEKVDE